jgi:hypothetical protein
MPGTPGNLRIDDSKLHRAAQEHLTIRCSIVRGLVRHRGRQRTMKHQRQTSETDTHRLDPASCVYVPALHARLLVATRRASANTYVSSTRYLLQL